MTSVFRERDEMAVIEVSCRSCGQRKAVADLKCAKALLDEL